MSGDQQYDDHAPNNQQRIAYGVGDRIARLPFYTSLADEGLEYTKEVMKQAMNEIYPL